MPWAKLRSHAAYNLATSGVAHWKLRDLPVAIDDLEISGPSFYGYEPLQKALAQHAGVTPDRIVAAAGTSMANYLAFATLLKPGDEVLIEHPTYELLIAAARHVGATITRFPRLHEAGFALDPETVERAVTPRTKLIVVANLHNPSSAFADEATIRAIGEIGPRVLVDEVYLDAAFERAPKSAALLGDQFIVTSSLTKVYGLSGLRCGWIVAEPKLAEAMWRLNDLFASIPAHMAERASVIAIAELPRIRAHVRARLDRNRTILHRFLDSRAELDAPRVPYGTTAFPKLLRGSVTRLCDLLRSKYETTVVPGEYFEMPDHFRIGIGGDAEPLEEGLRRLGLALDDMMEN
ncbi:MAG: pyridoxal phosphate-dependent aminotransferase [Acidobacteriia bacterium]|nr:pyridoxal phosphate-dependent aminotransferase [Terriglobia bacterium]